MGVGRGKKPDAAQTVGGVLMKRKMKMMMAPWHTLCSFPCSFFLVLALLSPFIVFPWTCHGASPSPLALNEAPCQDFMDLILPIPSSFSASFLSATCSTVTTPSSSSSSFSSHTRGASVSFPEWREAPVEHASLSSSFCNIPRLTPEEWRAWSREEPAIFPAARDPTFRDLVKKSALLGEKSAGEERRT